MAQGRVLVTSENLGQGETNEVERIVLFVGHGTKNVGSIQAINPQSDLDDLLGVNTSILKTQVAAAIANSDALFRCFAMPTSSEGDHLAAIDTAMEQGISVDGIIVCKAISSSQDVLDLFAKQQEIENTYQRFMYMLTAARAIDPLIETWADYQTALQPLTDGVAASSVGVVPLLHGNDLGAVVGRLCKYAVTVADTPIRVATGPMIGLGSTPIDSAGIPLPSATTAALDDMRFSCTQTYPDFDGVYFGDVNLLDAEGGDFQVIENLRVLNKARRAVRIRALHLVGNRQLNQTPSSQAWAKRRLSAPLDAMAQSVQINGEVFPGEIATPDDDAIAFKWETRSFVRIFMRIRPIGAAKTIVVSIGLDLSVAA